MEKQIRNLILNVIYLFLSFRRKVCDILHNSFFLLKTDLMFLFNVGIFENEV